MGVGLTAHPIPGGILVPSTRTYSILILIGTALFTYRISVVKIIDGPIVPENENDIVNPGSAAPAPTAGDRFCRAPTQDP